MKEKEVKQRETPWADWIVIAVVIFVAAAFAWVFTLENRKSYNDGYIDGQNSVRVKYSFHGTVQHLDISHVSYTEIEHLYGCKLYQTYSEYGCKLLTDTLKVEVTTK